jgi:two-component system NtrC family sensor kinase
MRVDRDGPVTHVVTLGEDVTEWKAAVERTAQAEKLAAIGQLAAGVMHEINNPLATVAACAETMTLALADLPRDRQAPPGFGEYLRIIDHEVHRCTRIIDGLLNFSRARPVQRVPLGVNAVVEQTLFLLKHHTRFKRCPAAPRPDGRRRAHGARRRRPARAGGDGACSSTPPTRWARSRGRTTTSRPG